jgi:CheY-specific phosphatase CheX
MTPASPRPDLRRIAEASLREVLGTLLSLSATLPNSSNQGLFSRPSDQITTAVQLAGPRLSGSVHLHLPRAFITRAAHVLTGLDGSAGETDALQHDTAGELVNMVAGRVAAGLATEGYVCTLGIPSVSHSLPLPSEVHPGMNRGRTELICEGHALSLEVQCLFARP